MKKEQTRQEERAGDTPASACNNWLSCIFSLAHALSSADERLQVVKNQEDKSTDLQVEAATFLKFDGARMGRDLELYNFMTDFEGKPGITVRLLEELVLPLKNVSSPAFKAGISRLRSFDIFGIKQEEWSSLLDDLEG